jgi:hypothetical protein
MFLTLSILNVGPPPELLISVAVSLFNSYVYIFHITLPYVKTLFNYLYIF